MRQNLSDNGGYTIYISIGVFVVISLLIILAFFLQRDESAEIEELDKTDQAEVLGGEEILESNDEETEQGFFQSIFSALTRQEEPDGDGVLFETTGSGEADVTPDGVNVDAVNVDAVNVDTINNGGDVFDTFGGSDINISESELNLFYSGEPAAVDEDNSLNFDIDPDSINNAGGSSISNFSSNVTPPIPGRITEETVVTNRGSLIGGEKSYDSILENLAIALGGTLAACLFGTGVGKILSFFSGDVPVNDSAANAKECILDGLTKTFVNGLLLQLTNEYIRWAGSGFDGKAPTILSNPREWFQDEFVNNAIGHAIDGSGLGVLCDVRLKFDLPVLLKAKYQEYKIEDPACTVNDIEDNLRRNAASLERDFENEFRDILEIDPELIDFPTNNNQNSLSRNFRVTQEVNVFGAVARANDAVAEALAGVGRSPTDAELLFDPNNPTVISQYDRVQCEDGDNDCARLRVRTGASTISSLTSPERILNIHENSLIQTDEFGEIVGPIVNATLIGAFKRVIQQGVGRYESVRSFETITRNTPTQQQGVGRQGSVRQRSEWRSTLLQTNFLIDTIAKKQRLEEIVDFEKTIKTARTELEIENYEPVTVDLSKLTFLNDTEEKEDFEKLTENEFTLEDVKNLDIPDRVSTYLNQVNNIAMCYESGVKKLLDVSTLAGQNEILEQIEDRTLELECSQFNNVPINLKRLEAIKNNIPGRSYELALLINELNKQGIEFGGDTFPLNYIQRGIDVTNKDQYGDEQERLVIEAIREINSGE